MRRHGAGSVNLRVLANLLAGVASLVAVITVALVAWQVREDSRVFREGVRVELLWHLADRWNSAEMGEIRSAAAAALLSGNASTEVGAVLDFFEQMALLIKRGVLDEEGAAQFFYWPLANYWAAGNAYVRQVQREDPSAWQTIPDLVQRLDEITAHRTRRGATEVGPSADEVQQFLRDEQGDNACADDSEVQKTPA